MSQKGNVYEMSDYTLKIANKTKTGLPRKNSRYGNYLGEVECEKDVSLPLGLLKKGSL